MNGHSMTKLLLFDIDGTLVNSHGSGRLALADALQAAYGTKGHIETIPLAGCTDWQIVRNALSPVGITENFIEAGWEKFCQQAPAYLKNAISTRGISPQPGVLELLARLQESVNNNFAVLGLVTGNLETTSPIKLRHAGIEPAQFRVGAYGSDAGDRNALPAIAVASAKTLTGHQFVGKNIVVIGDTPADIACGKTVNATTIGLATGTYTERVLLHAGADFVFADMQNTDAFLSALLS